MVVPTASAQEAAVVEGVEIIAVSSLAQAVAFFAGQIELDPTPPRLDEWFRVYAAYDVDFADGFTVTSPARSDSVKPRCPELPGSLNFANSFGPINRPSRLRLTTRTEPTARPTRIAERDSRAEFPVSRQRNWTSKELGC